MERLFKVLRSRKDISDWKVNIVKTSSEELFYVQKKLETNRATDVEDISVTIYVDIDKNRGSSTFTIYPYMDEEEINKKIDENVFAAKFALNPFFEIPSKQDVEIEESKSNLKDRDFKDIIKDVKEAVFEADNYEDGYLSATEIFLYKIDTRIVNSKGIDVSYTSYKGNIETIPSWRKGGEEVELYKMIEFESFLKEDIYSQVKEVLDLSHARSEAVPLKEVKQGTKIILENEEVGQLFNFFASDLTYGRKFQRVNLNEIGDCVQGENITGDKLNLKVVPYYENAIGSRAVDSDGVVLKEVSLIEDGIAKNRYGDYRFGYYLGEKNPKGMVPVIVVSKGNKSILEMEKEPYVRCVRFSGMQLDPFSGFIGGEVRLGFYFDGEKEIPVTGFSISGNIHQLKGSLVYSSEEVTLPRYHGPKYIEIKGMKIM